MGNTFFYDKWYKKILLLLCLTSDSLNRPYTDGSCLSSHGCCCFYQVKQVIFKHWDSFFSDWEKERKSIIIIRGGDQISFFLFENGSREQEEKKVMDWKYCAAFLLLWPLHNKHPKMGAHTHTREHSFSLGGSIFSDSTRVWFWIGLPVRLHVFWFLKRADRGSSTHVTWYLSFQFHSTSLYRHTIDDPFSVE
jgi:hypothetical protein